jgi:hypothetical protein
MKRISIIIMMLALTMGLLQCKKNEDQPAPNGGESRTIMLDVKSNGTKVDINTTTGLVNFETGDQIHVGSGGKYVGTLTYNGTVFTGAIANAVEGSPLQFYFLGNVTPAETLTSGITEICSVDISDQTIKLPLISAAPSYENYTASNASYTAQLLNKCALVKLNVSTASSAATCITGMNNKMTLDFSENTLKPSKIENGTIKVAGSGEQWVILLPQAALEEGATGSAYSEDFAYIGTRGAVPAIVENGYLTTGIPIFVGTVFTGAINGKFTINSRDDQVFFSKGNLQYQASTNTWRFAANQYDYVGSDNSNISSTYNGWIDVFAWGTSGWDHGAVCYQPWSSSINDKDFYAYGDYKCDLNSQTGKADWGYNVISNGINLPNQWRTLTSNEWHYVFTQRSPSSGIRYAKAVVNGVNGVVLLPDNWNAAIHDLNNTNEKYSAYSSNEITAAEWGTMESNGAVFLPAAGESNGSSAGSVGLYWSATSYHGSDDGTAYCVKFNPSLQDQYSTYRRFMFSVRLVHDTK